MNEDAMFTLYDFAPSGNCYKLRLAMSLLAIEYERVPIDITRGESRTDAFLCKNPNGRVPVLETAGSTYIPESNAALWYLSAETALRPTSRLGEAEVLQWMFFEQYSHEPFIATSRYWISILGAEAEYKLQLEEKHPQGYAALDVMEGHLKDKDFFVGTACTIADIALYAYTHVAHEGGFDLGRFPRIQAWFSKIERLDRYVSIDH